LHGEGAARFVPRLNATMGFGSRLTHRSQISSTSSCIPAGAPRGLPFCVAPCSRQMPRQSLLEPMPT